MSNFTPSAIATVLLSLASVMLVGCFDTRQEIILNSDGRGKAIIESTFAQTDLLSVTENTSLRDRSANHYVRGLLEESSGIEAWRDVSITEMEDGRISFRGTAYFRDLSLLKSAFCSMTKFKFAKDKNGLITLTLAPDTSNPRSSAAASYDHLTPDTIGHQRKLFRAAKPMLTAMLSSMKCETTFRFAGRITRVSNFEQRSPQELRHRFDGERVLDALEQLLSPAFSNQVFAAISSTNATTSNFLVNEILHGQRGPIMAVIAPGEAMAFDYDAEVAASRESFRPVAKSLGLDETALTVAPPPVEGDPAKAEVTGINWNFGTLPHSYTLKMRAELPGSVLNVEAVEISRAETVEGVSLLNTSSHSARFNFQDISRSNLTFEINLRAPSVRSQGIAEVSGVLLCQVADNLRSVELVSGILRRGASSTEFETNIEEINRVGSGGDKLVLRTRITPKELMSLAVVDDTGFSFSLTRQGMMSIGSVHTFTYSSKRALPRAGKIIAQIRSGTKIVRVPFSVTNLALSGHSLVAN